MFSVRQFQSEQHAWSARNFGEQPPARMMLGLIEELGELAHALLKQEQGIRAGEGLVAKEKDAIGDLVVYLAGYCNSRGYDLEQILADTWAEVKLRDWKKNPWTAADIAAAQARISARVPAARLEP